MHVPATNDIAMKDDEGMIRFGKAEWIEKNKIRVHTVTEPTCGSCCDLSVELGAGQARIAALIRVTDTKALGRGQFVAMANAHRIEKAQRELEEARGLAHDARAPLNAIQAAIDYLVDAYGERDPELAEMLVEMKDRTVYAAQIVEQLLDRRGGVHVPVDVSEVVSRLASQLMPLAREAGVAVDVRCDGPAWTEGDPNDLARVVSNLLQNAVKYSPEGHAVTLTMKAGTLKAGTEHRLTVRDHGSGIPPGDLERIFQRRVQGEGAAPGFGLGLAIASDIVKQCGGSIRARNHPEGGAEFEVMLPACQPPAAD
jgi:signal transduction histidine kinase